MRTPYLTLILSAILPAAWSQTVLYRDTFDRPDSRNIDASLAGIADGIAPPLAADAVYSQPQLDPNNAAPTYGVQDGDSTNGGGAAIVSNQLQLAVGSGTSNAVLNRHFTDSAILTAGGFSVSLDVAAYGQTTSGQGGGFAIGMSDADAGGCGDAVDGRQTAADTSLLRMSGGFGTTIGTTLAAPAVGADFWVVLRGNNSLAWGGRSGVIGGVAGLAAKTGTISARFGLTSFAQGATVNYEVLYNNTVVGTGSFAWSGNDQNRIGIDARDSTSVVLDNFSISTWSRPATAGLTVSPDTVAADNPALPVTLTWTGTNLPAGAGYEITADRAVGFPSGGATGPADDSGGSVAATVNGALGRTTFTLAIRNASQEVIATATAKVNRANRPNVIVLLADDLGWSDLGCYGSEISTPNIDSLAANGMRFRQFYQSARCSPTRCALLSGLYPQQAAVDPSAPLPDLRNDNNTTFAETLGADGYRTYMAGKWHLGGGALLPENRGFQHVFRFSSGTAHSADQWNPGVYTFSSANNEITQRPYDSTNFYLTDVMGDYALDYINHDLAKADDKPFAMLLTFGAPHFPIQAPTALADGYMATYGQGWDVVRQARYNRQLANGVIDSRYPFPGLGGTGPHQAEPIVALPAWDTLATDRQADLTRRMALYAAMIEKIDATVGRIRTRLQETGQLDNTLILFLSDNGGNHEGGVFGNNSANALAGAALSNMGQPGQNDGIHYGGGWAHVSNTPLKLFKHFTHEGGIRAPLIVHWPAGFAAKNVWNETPTHLIDVVATIEDAAGADHPSVFNGHPVLPLEGISLRPLLNQQPAAQRALCVEHESNRMIRKGKWKLVTEAFTAHDSEFASHQKLLYDMDADPGETTDLAAANPAKVVELTDEWNAWCARVGLPASRQIAASPLNVTPGATPQDLFLDTFNRPDSNDVDAAAAGMSGNRVPPLGTGTTWFEGFEGSGTADSIQIKQGVLQLATGVGMSENGLNHNFTGSDLIAAGGFSVSLHVLSINTDATDTPNRFAGFGVGLSQAEAAAGNDIAVATPAPIRGNTGNPGCADCFVELALDGNLKLWTAGVARAIIPVGGNNGTLTAAFRCTGFTAGTPVEVSVWFNGTQVDLDPAGPSLTGSFAWSGNDENFIALSARAANHVWVDNLAVRTLPVAAALSVERALDAGLDGAAAGSGANPDGDRLDNFGEWAFGTDPALADDPISATSLVLADPVNSRLRFAHRRRTDAAALGIAYTYQTSGDLSAWQDVTPVEESAVPLPATPGCEAVTLSLPAESVAGRGKLFLRIGAR